LNVGLLAGQIVLKWRLARRHDFQH